MLFRSQPTAAQRFDEDVLEVEVSSAYFAHFVESNYLPLIQGVVEEETGLRPKITFSVAQEPFKPSTSTSTPPKPLGLAASLAPSDESSEPPTPEMATEEPEQTPVERPINHSVGRSHLTPLNERYVFETFIVGEGNRFAHAAAQAVGQSPGKTQFNPLVIYGGVGLGKTHLLQAIGHHAHAQESSCRVVYVPSERGERPPRPPSPAFFCRR